MVVYLLKHTLFLKCDAFILNAFMQCYLSFVGIGVRRVAHQGGRAKAHRSASPLLINAPGRFCALPPLRRLGGVNV